MRVDGCCCGCGGALMCFVGGMLVLSCYILQSFGPKRPACCVETRGKLPPQGLPLPLLYWAVRVCVCCATRHVRCDLNMNASENTTFAITFFALVRIPAYTGFERWRKDAIGAAKCVCAVTKVVSNSQVLCSCGAPNAAALSKIWTMCGSKIYSPFHATYALSY